MIELFLSRARLNPRPGTIGQPVNGYDLSVTPDGAAAYSIPLTLPPGRNGMQPNLSLNYNSKSPNGLLGVGWGLSGLSRITRCPRNLLNSTANSPVKFDATDLYCLDGNPLVLVSGTYGASAEYRTQHNIFAKILSFDGGEGGDLGPSKFEVHHKGGWVMTFDRNVGERCGYTASPDDLLDPTQTCSPAVFNWSVSKVADQFGNYMTITYRHNSVADTVQAGWELLPKEIRYTGYLTTETPRRIVTFKYQDEEPLALKRTDVIERYVAGYKSTITTRLTEIQIQAPHPSATETVRRYKVAYAVNGSISGRSLVSSVTECDGGDVCRPSTGFEWEPGSMNFDAPVNIIPERTSFYSSDHRLSMGDVDGDGYDDVVYQNADRRGVYQLNNRSGGFGTPTPILPLESTVQGIYNLLGIDVDYAPYGEFPNDPVIVDMNGDGASEIAWPQYFARPTGGSEWAYRIVTGGGLFEVGNVAHESFLSRRAFHVADVTGDGQVELIRESRVRTPGSDLSGLSQPYVTSFVGFSCFSYVTKSLIASATTFVEMPTHVFVQDLDGDGLAEVMCSKNRRFNAWRPGAPKVDLTLRNEEFMWPADLNGDGIEDIVQSTTNRLPFAFNQPRQDTIEFNLDLTINSGNGFAIPQTIPQGGAVNVYGNVYGGYVGTTGTTADKDDGVKIHDFNFDGKDDVVILKANSSMTVLLSNGSSGFSAITPMSTDVDGVLSVISSSNSHYAKVSDINGDGLPDIVRTIAGLGVPRKTQWFRRLGKRPDVITKVTNGLGHGTRVDYGLALVQPGSTTYTKTNACGGSPEHRCVSRGLWVVKT